MNITPDLSQSYHPCPKIYKAKKEPKPLKKAGKKTKNWEDGRAELKIIFKDNGITKDEIYPFVLENMPKLLKKYKFDNKNSFLGFAHTRRRNTLTEEQVRDPHFVVLANQNNHEIVDQKMPKKKAEALLDSIVKSRGW